MMKCAYLVTLMFVAVAGQSWEGNYFRLELEQTGSRYTIHGLWPEWTTGYCTNEKFNESKISDLLPKMNQDWPSDEGPNADFWSHEWIKHGTCTNMTQHTYFATALNKYDEYNSQCTSGSTCSICFTRDLSRTCHCDANAPGSCPK